MKTILILLALTSIVHADNCYVHERGSESWQACKEQAGQMEEIQRNNNQKLENIITESNQQATQSNHDDELLQRILQELKRQR